MPPVSEKQRRAMGAAMSGHSTLGIPQSVGKEFIAADKGGKLPASKSKAKHPARKGGPGSFNAMFKKRDTDKDKM